MGVAKPKRVSMQREFVTRMANSGDAVYSAEKAGYAHPQVAGAKLMRDPTIKNDIQKRLNTAIEGRLGDLAIWRMEKILADDKQKGSVHVAAIKLVWSHVHGRNINEKELAEMTPDELRQASQAAHAALEELKSRAKTIDHDEPPIEAEAASIFD